MKGAPRRGAGDAGANQARPLSEVIGTRVVGIGGGIGQSRTPQRSNTQTGVREAPRTPSNLFGLWRNSRFDRKNRHPLADPDRTDEDGELDVEMEDRDDDPF